MNKVTGQLYYSVFAECPGCGWDIELTNIQDDEYELSKAIFNSKWTDMDIEYSCPTCSCKFVLDSVEY